jgi:hypothetical protein
MNELDRLVQLYARRGVQLGAGSEAERLAACAAFTRAAAWELRGEGFGLIRKTAGSQVNGLDVDKIQNWNTGEVYDIIIAAGGLSPRIAFQHVETSTDRARWVSPTPPSDQAPPASEPPHEIPDPTGRPLVIDADDVRCALKGLMQWHGHAGEALPSVPVLVGRALAIAEELALQRERR